MDYSRLMMGIGSGDSGGGSVTPTTKKVSAYFAEPNLPQQYVETLGAPFGDRYVYTIFMQGINVLPEIPSSAEGSELTARVKEENGNEYLIMEYYFVKQEGEWVKDGKPKTISEWTKETESSGGGGNVFLQADENNYLVTQDSTPVSVSLITNWIDTGAMPWLSGAVFSPLYSVNGSPSGFTVEFGETRFTAKNLDEALVLMEQH